METSQVKLNKDQQHILMFIRAQGRIDYCDMMDTLNMDIRAIIRETEALEGMGLIEPEKGGISDAGKTLCSM